MEHTDSQIADGMRFAMRRLAQSVTVISARHESGRVAMAATAVNSLSLDPPSMLVVVNRQASLFTALRAGARFCINVLTRDQQPVAEHCGGGSRGEDRFTIGAWEEQDGVPCLRDAQARIHCVQDGYMTYGTHGVFIGRVTATQVSNAVVPLIYADGRYHGLAN